MAADTSKILLPRSVSTTLLGKVKDASTIAILSPSEPKRFTDDAYLVFNPSAEAEVVEEGAKKGSYELDLSPVEAKRIKVVTTTRVSSELRWADEDDQLDIISNIMVDQAAALGRALDYVVYHAINPKSGEVMDGYTALTAAAASVASSGDAVTDLDAMTDLLIDWEINGIALSRAYANELRKVRVAATGARLYPEIPLNLNVGNLDGIPAATSGTVNGRLATTATGVKAIMGDFNAIKWGMIRDIAAEVIEYGDPDNTGVDLKGSNQVAYRTESVLCYAVLDSNAFAVLTEATA